MADSLAPKLHSHGEHRSVKYNWQHSIARQLSDLWNSDIDPDQICDSIQSPKHTKHGQFALPLHRIQHLFKSEPWRSLNAVQLAQWVVSKLQPSDYVEKAIAIGSFVNFVIPRSTFTESVLQQIIDDSANYGFGDLNSNFKESDTDASIISISCDLPMLPHFLDPNHYRGLVLATFLQRSYRIQGRKVRLINTLTTWNAEFGYLALAVSKYGLSPASDQDGLTHMNHIYHQIKQDALKDGNIEDAAQKYLLDLEKGDDQVTKLWQELQNAMIKEYQRLFDRRLFIEFDLHVSTIPSDVLAIMYDLLEQCEGLMKTDTGEWKLDLEFMDLGTPLLRNSKGISTQLTRDIAQRITQDQHMSSEYHIAGHHLVRHLQQLDAIVTRINSLPSSKRGTCGQQYRCLNRSHVDFAKVNWDASATNKLTSFCLIDCLDSLQQTMLEIMEENEGTEKYDAMMAQLGQLSATTKNKMISDLPTNEKNSNNNNNISGVSTDDLAKQHADKLGVCTMIAHQCAQKRSKPTAFSSSSPPDVFGNSGVFLQYVHSRLCGIERQLFKRGLLQRSDGGDRDNNYCPPTSCALSMGKLLYQQEAFDVIDAVTQFPRVMQLSQLAMDPSALITYLFKLARTANQSLYRLRIKDTHKDLALARWTLFWAAKQTLANGLTALGIEPVYRI